MSWSKDVSSYQTVVFDCDGVVLNSNKIKTQAFYEATKHFGHEYAKALVDYHVTNGGVSRYAKAKYFITTILQKPFDEKVYQDILNRFALAVKEGLLKCDIAEGLAELKQITGSANWLIVSGGDQAELREIFALRDLAQYFEGGIFGSPDNKDIILSREIENGNVSSKALFIGDSKYDFVAAKNAALDFVFMTEWTEVKEYKQWCENNEIHSLSNLKSLTFEV